MTNGKNMSFLKYMCLASLFLCFFFGAVLFAHAGPQHAPSTIGTLPSTIALLLFGDETPAPNTYRLNVTTSTGGSVSSLPTGINCGSDCSEIYALDTQVTLTATSANGYDFNGWSGACSGNQGCSVTMNSHLSVSASFIQTNIGVTPLVDVSAIETSGKTVTAARLRSGIPFPKGMLNTSDNVGIYDGDQLLPTQVKPLSIWDDGTVRWLLVDTEVPLAANQNKSLSLNKLDTPVPISGAISIDETTNFITVDTGAVRAEIPRNNGGIFHRVFVNNEIVIDAPSGPITDRGPFATVFDSSNRTQLNISVDCCKTTRLHLSTILSRCTKIRSLGPGILILISMIPGILR